MSQCAESDMKQPDTDFYSARYCIVSTAGISRCTWPNAKSPCMFPFPMYSLFQTNLFLLLTSHNSSRYRNSAYESGSELMSKYRQLAVSTTQHVRSSFSGLHCTVPAYSVFALLWSVLHLSVCQGLHRWTPNPCVYILLPQHCFHDVCLISFKVSRLSLRELSRFYQRVCLLAQ